MIRRTLLSAVALAAALTGAQAADLGGPPPSYGYAPAAAAPQGQGAWTGFYAGVSINGAVGNDQVKLESVFNGQTTNARTFSGRTRSSFGAGLNVGYNFEVDRAWVVGVESDFSFLGMNRRTLLGLPNQALGPIDGTITSKSDTSWMSTARVRAGFLVTPELLVYATGGLAIGEAAQRNHWTFTFNNGGQLIPIASAYASQNQVRVGYTLGAGLEYAISPALTVKAEYAFADLGRSSLLSTDPATGLGFRTSYRNNMHLARVGMNYRFNAF